MFGAYLVASSMMVNYHTYFFPELIHLFETLIKVHFFPQVSYQAQ